MFTDMRISSESATTFRNWLNRHGVCNSVLICDLKGADDRQQQLPFELSVSVLTASYWPQQIVSSSSCNFGNLLTASTNVYTSYYDSRHSGRRLTWQGNLGTADVKVRFKSRSHDLNVSTQALVVLLLFEEVKEGENLSYGVSINPGYRPRRWQRVGMKN